MNPRANILSGVRPSPGAASPERVKALNHSGPGWPTEVAAPEDGRTPANRPVVVLHSYGGTGGGIWRVVNLIRTSPLAAKYDFRLVESPEGVSSYHPRALLHLLRAMRAHQPDLIHVNGLLSEGFVGMLAARCCRGAKVVLSAHGFSKDAFFANRLRRLAVGSVLEPLTVALADSVHCVCGYGSRQRAIRWFSRQAPRVLRNVVELTPLEPATAEARSLLGRKEGEVVALCVSRITRAKGLLVLARALDYLAAQGIQNLRVVLVGDGPDWDLVQQAFQAHIQSGRATFLGRRSDVRALLRAADFFVLPSLNENLSMAVLEAMEAGLAVVACNAGGNPEVVVLGETGLLVPPNEPVALAQAMAALSESSELRQRLGRAGRGRVAAQFNCDRFSQQLDSIYQQVLSARPRVQPHGRKALCEEFSS